MENLFEKLSNELYNNILEDEISTAYHYTSKNGLLGILDSKSLWLTDTRFLNDPDEQRHGINESKKIIIDTVLKNIKSEKWDTKCFEFEILRKIKDTLVNMVNIKQGGPVYCISFCEEGDLLSQWKGYSNYGDGYSIGFNINILYESIKKLGNFYLGKIIYEDKNKKEAVNKMIEVIVNNKKYFHKYGEKKFIIISVFFLDLLTFYMKSSFFEEENEWRIIYVPNHDKNITINHRTDNLGIIPYVKINVESINEKISEIITGPQIKYDLNKIALSNYIDSKKIEKSSNNLRG